MKYLIKISILILFATPVFAYDVPDQIVDAGVAQSVTVIDNNIAKINSLNAELSIFKGQRDNLNNTIEEYESKITVLQTEIDQNKQSLTALANQNPPIQSAVDLLDEHPEYGAENE